VIHYGSVCSGIEAASAAWKPLGWHCSFMSEIEPFPRAVLHHHYPEIPLHGDFTTIQTGDYEPIDVLVGGTPCQSFSVAGLRGGMADSRGNLALEYLRLADRLRPRWVVWENVPGVLSSAGGRDFGAFVGGLAELGYGWSYRVLDAQYFGLAQRRKRVFVVGYFGDWRRAASVLFEPASLRWHPAPRRETRERVAGGAETGTGNGIANPLGAKRDGGWRGDLDNDTFAIQDRAGAEGKSGPDGIGCQAGLAYTLEARHHVQSIAMALNAHGGSGRMDGESETFVAGIAPALSRSNPYGDHESREGLLVASAYRTSGNCGAWDTGDRVDALNTGTDPGSHLIVHSLRAEGFDASEDGTGRGIPLTVHSLSATATGGGVTEDGTGRGAPLIPVESFTRQSGGDCRGPDPQATASVLTKDQTPAITGSAVRHLTPRECERLQGFSDDYTLIPFRGKPAADGPRYRALGNSMAVPVMVWIGKRIEAVDGSDDAPGLFG
jgi:DNA (cytosine-5)-methyltransferase 1